MYIHIYIYIYIYTYTYTYTYTYECNVSHARNTRVQNAHIITIMLFTHINEYSHPQAV